MEPSRQIVRIALCSSATPPSLHPAESIDNGEYFLASEQRLAPFDLLATELITHIFLLGARGEIDSANPRRGDPSGLRRTILLVCRRWNTIVRGHPKLEVWSFVKTTSWIDFSKRQLNDAVIAATSIHVDIRMKEYTLWNPTTSVVPTVASPSITLRVPSIRVAFDHNVLEAFQFLMQYCIFELENTRGYSGVKEELEEVELCNTEIDNPGPRIHVLPKALHGMVNLRRLSLKSIWFADAEAADQVTLSLPLLQTLILDDIPELSLHILNILDTPALKSLAIRCIPQSDTEWFLTDISQLSSIRNAILYGINNTLNFAFILFSIKNVVNLSLLVPLGGTLLSVLTQKEGVNHPQAILAKLATFRLEAPEAVLNTIPGILRGRLPQRLQRSHFQILDEAKGPDYVEEDLDWMKQNAGCEDATPESFMYEALVNALP
ncbi:hypothetical protein FRB95_010490 [Tulasnella sp. JGI-2019a]|nr:hypothetical protein FRB95_010490 [Tulasnella sp. JGI-2019a]